MNTPLVAALATTIALVLLASAAVLIVRAEKVAAADDAAADMILVELRDIPTYPRTVGRHRAPRSSALDLRRVIARPRMLTAEPAPEVVELGVSV
jgi:hypothetical protein